MSLEILLVLLFFAVFFLIIICAILFVCSLVMASYIGNMGEDVFDK